MLVYDHVTANLSWIESIVRYFEQADDLVSYDMEDEDIEGMVACIDQELFDLSLVFVDPAAEVIGHQESHDGRYGQGEELLERRAPVHVGCEIF